MTTLQLLDRLDYASYVLEAALAALLCALAFLRAHQRRDGALYWMFYLLAGFFGCVCLSDAFFLLTWALEGYPYVFSPGDLSWVGGYLFLITIFLGLLDDTGVEARRRGALPALAAPAVVLAATAVNIALYPDIVVQALIYNIPAAVMACLALKLWLAGGRGYAHRPFCLAVLAWTGVQLLCNLFSTLGWSYGYAVPITVGDYVLAAATASIWFAAKKGVRKT